MKIIIEKRKFEKKLRMVEDEDCISQMLVRLKKLKGEPWMISPAPPELKKLNTRQLKTIQDIY